MNTTLPREEWDLGSIPKEEQLLAWHWEFRRQTEAEYPGRSILKWSEYFLRPYLSIPLDYRQARVRDHLDQKKSLDEINAHDATEFYTDSDFFAHKSSILVHRFQIDWTASKSKINADFQSWLDESYACYTRRKTKSKSGRKNDALGWLADLAIYRIAKHGHTRKEAEEILQWVKARRSTAFSPSHFEDAQRRIVVRLKHWLKQSASSFQSIIPK